MGLQSPCPERKSQKTSSTHLEQRSIWEIPIIDSRAGNESLQHTSIFLGPTILQL
jgi:hypothetical protein